MEWVSVNSMVDEKFLVCAQTLGLHSHCVYLRARMSDPEQASARAHCFLNRAIGLGSAYHHRCGPLFCARAIVTDLPSRLCPCLVLGLRRTTDKKRVEWQRAGLDGVTKRRIVVRYGFEYYDSFRGLRCPGTGVCVRNLSPQRCLRGGLSFVS